MTDEERNAAIGALVVEYEENERLIATQRAILHRVGEDLTHLGIALKDYRSSGPHHQDSGEAKIRESTAGVSRKPSSDCKACGCSSKHLCGLTAWNT